MTDQTAPAKPARSGSADAVLKLDEFLPYRLNVCANMVSNALSAIYADRYKIGVPEWRVLVTLGEFGLMTAKAIGIHSHMHKTKVSRAVALLERRKLVARARQRDDLREAFLSLTPAGRDIYSDLAPIALEFARQLMETHRAGRPRRARPRAQQADRAIDADRRRYRQSRQSRIDLPACAAKLAGVIREALFLFPLVRRLSRAHRAQSQGPAL